jgi:hypothetical protein
LQAPADNLDELVSSHSAKESDLEFVIPANISTVALQMGDVGEGSRQYPLRFGNSPQVNSPVCTAPAQRTNLQLYHACLCFFAFYLP